MTTTKQNLLILIFSVFITLFLAGCFEKPEFSFTPEISNARVVRTPIGTPLTPADSLIITVDFKDGNGDLGLFEYERNPLGNETSPYQQFFYEIDENGDTLSVKANAFFYNYFVRVFRKENGEFVEVTFPNDVPYSGGFAPLFETEPAQNPPSEDPNRETPVKGAFSRPMEGELNRNITIFPLGIINAFDTLRFEIQIADRARNLSNIVETDTVVVLKGF